MSWRQATMAQRTFTVTVLPQIFPPTISTPANTNTLVNTPVTVLFTIGDLSAPAASLTVTAAVDANSGNVQFATLSTVSQAVSLLPGTVQDDGYATLVGAPYATGNRSLKRLKDHLVTADKDPVINQPAMINM